MREHLNAIKSSSTKVMSPVVRVLTGLDAKDVFVNAEGGTNNCQLSVLGSLDSLLNYIYTYNNNYTKEQLLSLNKVVSELVEEEGQFMFLADVDSIYEKLMDGAFQNAIQFQKMPYESSNGSNMIIYLVQISHNSEHTDLDDYGYDDDDD